MTPPDDRRYSESHEWHRLDGDTVTLGVTKFAVDELTDITYAEMKPAGTAIEPGGSVGEIESVKATADVYSAVGGEIVEVNPRLADDPSVLNTDPYGEGWLVRIKTADPSPLDRLMDAKTYASKHE
ncbi:MAG: glycine cleavage system protein GcvH [Planctomycetota bacterium]|nr:MAG: glycine cleavage system protein GcvH [Planctomycetota bacterium]